MKLRVLSAICCAVLTSLPALPSFAATKQAAEPGNESIAVVKTWRELSERPVIRFNEKTTVRLGIENIRAPRFSGVMLYCLTEGYDGRLPQQNDPEFRIGPLVIELKRENAAAAVKLGGETDFQERAHHVTGKLLFVQLIPLSAEGRHLLSVKDREGRPFGNAAIEATPPEQPWSPLSRPQVVEVEEPETDGVAAGAVAFNGEGMALPLMLGVEPVWYEALGGERGPLEFYDDELLPSVMRQEPRAAPPVAPAMKEQVAKAVAQLASDDFDVREQASATLAQFGRKALGALRHFEKSTDDAEVRARLRRQIDEIDSDFQISYDRGDVFVMMRNPFVGSDPETSFLARCWINGKPYCATIEAVAQDLGGHSVSFECTHLRLKFTLDAEKLGLSAGGKIGLQMLYCPCGWKTITTEDEVAKRELADRTDYMPRVSNKIEFTTN
ncbi:MAG TPA: hypothetical protein VEK08_22950 [Planctomycetota bacterium]|nr:hypothetical protein [Planctomycetota bacterium]